jgi:hypothetical protein
MEKKQFLDALYNIICNETSSLIIMALEKSINEKFEELDVSLDEAIGLIQSIAVNTFCDLFDFTKHILKVNQKETRENIQKILFNSLSHIETRLRIEKLDN